MQSDTKNNPRLTTGLLVLLFTTPLLAAHLLYHYRDRISFKTIEAGILLTPPLAAQSFDFFDPTFLGKWQLVSFKMQARDSEKVLSVLSGIHTALGKEKNRVEYRILPAAQAPLTLQGQFALIDPQGWIILCYPEDTTPQGILRDTRRLLRVSHGG